MEFHRRTPRAQRIHAWAPVEVEPDEGGPRLAILRNASSTGVLLSARSRPEVGQTLSLRVVTREGVDPPGAVRGHVVRVDESPEGSHWPWSFGVRFEEPIEELVDGLRDDGSEPS